MRRDGLNAANAISEYSRYRHAHHKVPYESSWAKQCKSLVSKTVNLSWRLIKISGTAFLVVCRQLVKFWMIPPLGSADQLRVDHADKFGRRHFL
jgi:hypothetical protein